MRKSPSSITTMDKPTEQFQESADTHVLMDSHGETLPTDGAKITPRMLDSKTDLQELIDGAEMFKTVEYENKQAFKTRLMPPTEDLKDLEK